MVGLGDFKIIGPLCYMGKPGCDSPECRHWWKDGEMQPGCIGYHCSYCDEPCGPQGHKCPVGEVLLAESAKVLAEEGTL